MNANFRDYGDTEVTSVGVNNDAVSKEGDLHMKSGAHEDPAAE